MKKVVITLAALMALAGVGLWQFAGAAKMAPDITFVTLTGQKITPADLRGKVVLIDFWATSCLTCIKQMPGMIKIYNKLAPKGYEAIFVAMKYDPPNYVQNYAQTRKLPFPVVIDAQSQIAKAYGNISLTPTAFLIDKQGHIIKRYLGNHDVVVFTNTIEKALAG